MLEAGTPVACNETSTNIITGFINYGNSTSDNPYAAAVEPYRNTAPGATDHGVTGITATGSTYTITTQWDGGSQTSTLVKE